MGHSATIVIDRPVPEVFEYVMDIPHDAEWRTGIVEAAYVSDGPPRVGVKGFDRVASGSREFIAAWTAFEYEPGRLARWEFDSGPLRGTGGYVCEPDGDGTRFTLEANVKPAAGWLRFLRPVFAVMVRLQTNADVRKLKAILEGAA